MKLSVRVYILIAVTMLTLAVLVSVGVFLLIQQEYRLSAGSGETPSVVIQDTVPGGSGEGATSTASEQATSTVQPTRQPVPLRDLPLTEAQRKTAETFGIDTETFVITPDMQYCAEQKLGEARVSAIVSGDTPTLTEGLTLLGCL